MRYQTENKGESTYLLGEFASGETVTIILYDISTGNTVAVDSASCSEIGSTGWFRWNTENITIAVTVKTDYLYIMNDSNGFTYSGKFVIGGYVDIIDEIKTEVDKIQTIDDNVDVILVDTNELQTNQGNWITATGFSTHSVADIWNYATRSLTSFGSLIFNIWHSMERTLTAGTKDAEIDAIQADLNNPDQYKASGFATQNPPSQDLNDYKADISGLNALILDITKLTGNKVIRSGDIITIYESDGITIWREYDLSNGGRVLV